MRRVPVRFLTLLFVAFALLTVLAARTEVFESSVLWMVRDAEKIEPAGISDTARIVWRNFQVMLDRTPSNYLPVAVPLDLWTMLAGGSFFAARIPILFLILLLSAVLYRFIKAYALLPVLLCLGMLAFNHWYQAVDGLEIRPAVDSYLETRQPDEPFIINFSDDSPWGYYNTQYNLGRGMNINLGWRDFSDAEITQAICNLGDKPAWFSGIDSRYETVLQHSGRIESIRYGTYPEIIRRYDRTIPPEAGFCDD